MPKHLYILLLLAAFVLVGCADETTNVPSAPTPSAPTAERAEVPLSFDATLSDEGPASRAAFTYGDVTSDPPGKKGLKVTWQEGDALGVYIKTAEGTILRAGRITTHTGGEKTQHFVGHALELFEDEHYIYMHPDIGRETYVNLEEMDGELGSTAHIAKHLPIVWDPANSSSPYVGRYKGYVIHLELDFQTTNPGLIRKVTLLTSSRGPSGLQEDRIFPRHYSINQLAKSSEIFDASNTGSSDSSDPAPSTASETVLEGIATNNADFTNAITLNVTSGTLKSEVRSDGKTYYSTDVYLTSSAVKNLNLYPTKFYVLVVGDRGMLFQSTPVSFNGQGEASGSQLLSNSVLRNGIVGRVAATMSSGNISPTIINADYKIASILGMWNEYGKPYDPNGLVFYKTGPSSYNAGMPDVLVENGNAIHDRYILTDSNTGTPTFTWNLYESQNATSGDGAKQSDVTCNNIDIVEIPAAATRADVQKGTEIFVSFLSEYAWNQNLLGYYHYKTGSAPASATDVMKYIIFPNLSKPGHEPFNSNGQAKNNIGRNEDAPLEEYMTVKLVYQEDNGSYTTIFPSGTTIGFWGMIDVKANGFQQTQYSLLNWNQWRFFSNSAWNADKLPDGKYANTGWNVNSARCNFFASGDICKTSTPDGTTVENIIPGIAIYGFMDDVAKGSRQEKTAFSTCIFLVSASQPAAMKTNNKACFNIGCTVPDKPTTSNYPTNLVINKN